MTGARAGRGHRDVPADAGGDLVTEVLATVRELLTELQPAVPGSTVRLDSDLAEDLGLDSLAVAELRVRLEQACDVRLPDQAVARGGTVADWVDVVAGARAHGGTTREPAVARDWRVEPAEPVGADTVLDRARSLGDVVAWYQDTEPARVHVRFLDHSADTDAVPEITYGALARRAVEVAAALTRRRVARGERVAIMLPTCVDYFGTFLGILSAGAVPVPLYPPTRPGQLEDHLRRQARILNNARAAMLVTVPEARGMARLLRAHVPALRSVVTPGELTTAAPDPGSLRGADPDDLALLQYTSGSTGDPKGVMLSHAQLLANIRALGAASRAGPGDVFVSWLPLYHDMGLVGAWLGSLCHGIPLVVMSPADFLARPARWLWAIHHHRATLSAAPNFGFELCLRIGDDELAGLDLGSWRIALNGAEPVSPATVRRFTERFARYGLRPGTVAPVYGLAEVAVGVTFPPLGREPPVDVIAREPFRRHGRARPASPDDTAVLRYVACGRPLPGYRVRVVDAAGRVVDERREGRIQVTGPSATAGYHGAPEQTARLRHGEWLDTGDLGYTAHGDLYVTGRAKDVIIRGGRNLHPSELEDAVGDVPGVRKGCVAVFGVTDPGSGTEHLVVLAETRLTDPAAVADLRHRVRSVTVDVLGAPPNRVVIAPPGAVLKTSSGKVRRAATRQRYESGATARPAGPAWWQAARFGWAGLLPQLRRWRRAGSAALFAGYAWALLALLAPPVWLAVVTLPRTAWRWSVLRGACRLSRWLTRTPLSVVGAERLAGTGPCVIVANHASYLDGLAVTLAAPGTLTFVAAARFRPVRFVGAFLTRLGCQFVEPGQAGGGTGTQRIARVVETGRTVVVFPEGRLDPAPGLRAFHLGAFAVAADVGVPVVPAGIRGTRTMLPPGQRFPRRAAVQVRFAEPVPPTGQGWSAVVGLRDAARAAVLQASGEYDAAGGSA